MPDETAVDAVIARWLEVSPRLESRALKARTIFMRGAVIASRVMPDGRERYLVASDSGRGSYEVDVDQSGNRSCGCEDSSSLMTPGFEGAGSHGTCKHQLAVLLVRALGDDRMLVPETLRACLRRWMQNPPSDPWGIRHYGSFAIEMLLDENDLLRTK